MADICCSMCPDDLWFPSIRRVLSTRKHIDEKNPDSDGGIGFSGSKEETSNTAGGENSLHIRESYLLRLVNNIMSKGGGCLSQGISENPFM